MKYSVVDEGGITYFVMTIKHVDLANVCVL